VVFSEGQTSAASMSLPWSRNGGGSAGAAAAVDILTTINKTTIAKNLTIGKDPMMCTATIR
jgi:hypothetical protein